MPTASCGSTWRPARSQSTRCPTKRRCAPHGSLPPPHVGEGQGGGWPRSTEREASPVQRLENDGWLHLLCFGYETHAVRVLPPSLSLPHMGGGNVVALLCLK